MVPKIRSHTVKRFSLILLSAVLSTILIACSTTPKKEAPPPLEILDMSLSRGIEDKGTDSILLGESTTYYTNDAEVISYIKFKNVSGAHKIRWEWYKPDGELYCSTVNKNIKVPEGNFRKEMSLWHRLSLYGEPAVEKPGRWLVNVYLDNDIVSSSHFELKAEINIDTLPRVSQKKDPSLWGLIIGIENYPHLPAVTYADRDARLMRDYFEIVMGIPSENIMTLMGPDATKGKIEGLLKSYLPLNLDKNVTLYVYFAGHGIPSLENGDAFIVTYDGDPRFIEHTGYKLETLYADINALPIKRSVVFVDGCFSGASSRSGEMLIAGSRPALIRSKDMVIPADKVVSLTASQGDQLSHAYQEKEHGLFTYFLLSGMRGPADNNADGVITLDELYTYVSKNVINVSRRAGVEQTPAILPGITYSKEILVSKPIQE